MSSRKNLKKQINNSMMLLYNDCILYKVFFKDADQKKADELLTQISKIHSDLLSRVSVTEGKYLKGRVKLYYKKLNEDLKSQINKLGQAIENLD